MSIVYDDNFEVFELGEQEEWVYDIEVENNHNFFANDICVHNSLFLNFEPIVNKIFKDNNPTEEEIINFLTKVCDGVMQEVIDKSFDELCSLTNAYQNCLHMKREKICSSALWRKKKNYILNVWDNEGVRYAEPKIKMSGIEAVRTSTPAYCRKAIKNAINIIMNGEEEEVIKFIEETKKEFFTLTPDQIAFPRSASNIQKYENPSTIYGKSTPMHIRGCLLYNHYLKYNKLTHKYSLVQSADKIKYIYLKIPNPIHENVISFIQVLPKELGLDRYVDYELQFEKSFIDPVKSILDIIGWKVEKTSSLESFFM